MPHQRRKARKSMGRRVSFAPDAQLETRHLYPQVPSVCQLLQCTAQHPELCLTAMCVLQDKTPDQNSNPNVLNPLMERFSSEAFRPQAWQRDAHSPALKGSLMHNSPKGSTMELTGLTAVPANFVSSLGQGAKAPLSLDATIGRPLRLEETAGYHEAYSCMCSWSFSKVVFASKCIICK